MAEASSGHAAAVHRAIILAAGNGDRFHDGTPHSKLLTDVAGRPLLARTLESAFAAGLIEAHLVLGYDAESVRALAERACPAGLALRFHHNRDWHQENGRSVLAARAAVDDHAFALMMGDHIFEADALRCLIAAATAADEALLAVDRKRHAPEFVAEATKVRVEGDRIRAIGKTLDPYDALDTGLFVCSPAIFAALDASCAAGDSTLSGGVRRLAAQDLVRAVDIGAAQWCDVDTVADRRDAERLLRSTSRR